MAIAPDNYRHYKLYNHYNTSIMYLDSILHIGNRAMGNIRSGKARSLRETHRHSRFPG